VGREPAPGTQAAFGSLVKAWADSGAACPTRWATSAPRRLADRRGAGAHDRARRRAPSGRRDADRDAV